MSAITRGSDTAPLAPPDGPAARPPEIAPAARRGRLRVLLACSLGALLWASRLSLPEVSESFDVDPSWQKAYTWFHEHGLRAGVDYVFTYGPLAFLEYGEYDADLFWPKVLLWEFALGGALATVFALVSLRLASVFEQVLFFLLLLLVSLQTGRDTYLLLAQVGVTSLALGGASLRWPAIAAALALLATIALLKFTFLVLSAGCVALIVLHVALRRSALAAAGAILAWCALFVASWSASGQSLADLAPYFRTSLWIAAGYEAGMSEPAPGSRLALAAVASACFAVLLGARVGRRPRSLARFSSGALLAASFFLAFKSGFVRQWGELTFFGFAALAPFVVAALLANGASARGGACRLRSALEGAARAGCVVASLAGATFVDSEDRPASGVQAARVIGERWSTHVARHAGSLFDLGGYRARCESLLERLRRGCALPEIRRRVGEGTVDILPPYQALILLNGLNWRPRPVFQGYVAYTPELMELNRRFLSGERAPQFLIGKLEALEKRFPTTEDGDALQIALRDYRPLLVENDWMLLERARESPPARTERELVRESELALGERMDLRGLAGSCHVLAIDVKLSWRGRLRQFVYQASPLLLELRASDKKAYKYRITPAMTETGALLDPLMIAQRDVMRWYAGQPLPRLVSARLIVSEAERALYEPTVRIRVWRADDLLPQGSD